MVLVEFAPSLTRHVACAPQTVAAADLRAALRGALAAAPGLSHYVFDDQGAVRKHVAVFHNQALIRDRARLDVSVASGDRLYVTQALSGG